MVNDTTIRLGLAFFGIGFFLYWLHSSFGPYYALGAVIIAVILLFGTVMFVAGSGLAHKVQKNTLEGISKFNAQDATIDRYRMQSLREIAKGQSWQVKAEAQKQLVELKHQKRLEAKPVDETETFWSNTETVDLDDWS